MGGAVTSAPACSPPCPAWHTIHAAVDVFSPFTTNQACFPSLLFRDCLPPPPSCPPALLPSPPSSSPSSPPQARILVHGKVTHLGYYETEEEAACVYDKVSLALHGSNAQTNFPASNYTQEQVAVYRWAGFGGAGVLTECLCACVCVCAVCV